MITDAHVYCLPERLRSLSPLIPKENAKIEQAIYQHIDASWVLQMSSPEEISASMKLAGIERSVLVAFPWATQNLCSENNRFLLEVCQSDNRFSAICSVQPLDSSWQEEAEFCLKEGAVGLKVNAEWQGFDLDCREMVAVSRWAYQHGMFVMTHVDQAFRKSPASAASLLALVDKCPETHFLAAHLGGMLGLYAPFKDFRKRLQNIWFDTAISDTLYMIRFYLDCGLEKKVVFGTDFPFNHSHKQSQVVEGIKELNLGATIETAIFSTNFKELLAH
jgi:predicted TIM-barrel fold metal-dependent hydrolase